MYMYVKQRSMHLSQRINGTTLAKPQEFACNKFQLQLYSHLNTQLSTNFPFLEVWCHIASLNPLLQVYKFQNMFLHIDIELQSHWWCTLNRFWWWQCKDQLTKEQVNKCLFPKSYEKLTTESTCRFLLLIPTSELRVPAKHTISFIWSVVVAYKRGRVNTNNSWRVKDTPQIKEEKYAEMDLQLAILLIAVLYLSTAAGMFHWPRSQVPPSFPLLAVWKAGWDLGMRL